MDATVTGGGVTARSWCSWGFPCVGGTHDQRLTRVRRLIYHTLLADPRRHWTVRGLADALPVTAHALRDNLNLLVAEDIVAQVRHQRALTAVFTEDGKRTFTAIVRVAAEATEDRAVA
ncbi:hypothetical protein ACFFMR_26165 [Micromonospora andamanensis]|uniref:ArsR family transcriptional regulator n=1 Tax=Micromonospora andamanensis TaxID=1287068 RepID=A0ABQ4HS31_9ACTN|nr:hypothetical protein [Micromonospora andamanensis]GIJ08457.1 hypothetical protein Van01_16710 [Micromonospora andamanensis]